jgi:hypothetical protein
VLPFLPGVDGRQTLGNETWGHRLRWSFVDGQLAHGIQEPGDSTETVQELGRCARDNRQLERRLHGTQQVPHLTLSVDVFAWFAHRNASVAVE